MSSSVPSAGRHQRQLKNLLLDKRFQLKYTGYLVAVAAVLGLSLGAVLWRASTEVIAQSARGAAQGEQIVNLGHEVVAESRKVSAVVRMNIVKDPVYQQDPDLLAAFNVEAKQQDEKLDIQAQRLREQYNALKAQARSLKDLQRTMLWTLAAVLVLLITGIGAAGIVVTHKVAGPIFKMQRHLRDVAKGRLEVPWGLRKGDELTDFFDTFRNMVATLRQQREAQITVLKNAVEELATSDNEQAVQPVKRLINDLERSLE
jgi:nitrogen fixation/metabolism regulation signal transduction histidine kinase